MMTGRQKLYFLLDRINDIKESTLSGQPIFIHPVQHLNSKYSKEELIGYLAKLELEEKVIKIIGMPGPNETYLLNSEGYFVFELLPTYDEYFTKIQHEPAYQDFTGNKPPEKVESDKEISQKSHEPEIMYEITYTPTREILLNQTLQLAKPDFDRENDLVFNFLYQHPNKKHTLKEIETNIGSELGKTLHKIVENLGFKGDLRKIFFDVSGTSICFKNPVTKANLEKMGINRIKL